MKIKVDDVVVLELTDTQKQVIMHDVNEEIFIEDMKRRVAWVLTHKYEQCFERLKKEWDPMLASNGVAMIPTDKDAYAQLVLSQQTYKSRKQKDQVIKDKDAEKVQEKTI